MENQFEINDGINKIIEVSKEEYCRQLISFVAVASKQRQIEDFFEKK